MAPFRRAREDKAQAGLQHLADEELVHLVREGDPTAFGVIYDRHSAVAFSLAYRMSGKRSTAEDIVQEAFLSLWRANHRYDAQRGSVRTFLLGIVHNRAIDALRRSTVHDSRRASDEGIEERFEARDRTDEEAARRADAIEVRRALGVLPDDQLKVIELAYFGGFTHNEIAEMLETPLGTIKGRMRLGLEKLRGALGEGGVEVWT
jgi:RNA polymerase sigma-70 factor (ECF subfamily)